MQLKTLLREYLEEKTPAVSPRYDFLPNFDRSSRLPVEIEQVSWTRTGESERSLTFQRREDLHDFVNCYLELEEDMGVYASLTIEGLTVTVSAQTSLDPKFKSMIEEIARETRGH